METEALIKKYNIDVKKLEEEQVKLSKLLTIKDSIDFSLAAHIAGIDSVFIKNQIISSIVVIDENKEVVLQEYAQQKVRFPYLPGLRAYRELPAMLEAFKKLEEKPDVILIQGHGIAHPRLGLASHFSIAAEGIPTIGIANTLTGAEVQNNNIIKNEKIVGKVLQTKQGSRPLYMSPGNNISVEAAEKLVLRYTLLSHKFPEPLRQAGKFTKKIMKELTGSEESSEKDSQKEKEKEEFLE